MHRAGGYPKELWVPAPPEGEGLFGEDGGAVRRGTARVPEVEGAKLDPQGGPSEPSAFQRWVVEALARLLGPLLSLTGVSAGLAWPIAIALSLLFAAGVLALLVALVAGARLPRVARAAQVGGAPAPPSADPLLADLGMSPEAFAAQGRYGEAVHALFLRGLRAAVTLDGRVEERTARELVREASAAHRPPLDELLGRAELVWFGGRDATREDYERALALEAALRA